MDVFIVIAIYLFIGVVLYNLYYFLQEEELIYVSKYKRPIRILLRVVLITLWLPYCLGVALYSMFSLIFK